MKKYKKAGQLARNLGSAAAGVTIGLAAGGEPSDFVVGKGIAGAFGAAGKHTMSSLSDLGYRCGKTVDHIRQTASSDILQVMFYGG